MAVPEVVRMAVAAATMHVVLEGVPSRLWQRENPAAALRPSRRMGTRRSERRATSAETSHTTRATVAYLSVELALPPATRVLLHDHDDVARPETQLLLVRGVVVVERLCAADVLRSSRRRGGGRGARGRACSRTRAA
jgi:hypothetical protein